MWWDSGPIPALDLTTCYLSISGLRLLLTLLPLPAVDLDSLLGASAALLPSGSFHVHLLVIQISRMT